MYYKLYCVLMQYFTIFLHFLKGETAYTLKN